MRAFLLDTNIWAYLYDRNRYAEEYSNVMKRMDQIREPVSLGISVISWGEIAVGLPENNQGENSVQMEHLKFIRSQKPWTVGIDAHTAEQYGKLRGHLSSKRQRKKEDLVDRYTWLEVGSLENDLWIVAQAMTKDLILVTNDKSSLRPLVEVAGNELHVEYWAEEIT